MPSIIAALISATISEESRSLQRGQPFLLPRLAQFVTFSLIVIVKMPPSPGTPRNTCSSESLTQRRTSGQLVHIANTGQSFESHPRNASRSGCPRKKSSGIARGSFM